MTPLPFSGLSLIVHLGIIAIAYIAGLFGFTRKRKKGWNKEGNVAIAISTLKPVASLLILGFVGAITLSFIWTALSTGYTSGADEPQRMFVEEVYRDIEEGNMKSFFESHLKYQKTSPLFPFTDRILG